MARFSLVITVEWSWSYLSVAPQLVALHAMTVVQGDGAVVGDGIKANFLSVHGIAHPDVLSPAKCEHLWGKRFQSRIPIVFSFNDINVQFLN